MRGRCGTARPLMLPGSDRASAAVPAQATSTPSAAPPPSASSRPSASSCDASAAARGAERGAHRELALPAAACASSRLATLTQAISSTNADRAEQRLQRRPELGDAEVGHAA